ncbi:adenylyltransferase/cytidyltransferase family protein [Candidatus Woesearchaeota archaeon]|nr:adenylyltransferase/cytidyltransferase family protein [Candidatus Woesearchaeota archaeon]
MKQVMCFGTFDLLHIGHLDYFTQAKEHGDYLIVVIARDSTKEQEQKDIAFCEHERLQLISSLKIVDQAVLGYPEDHFKIIEEKKPDIIFLGYDHPPIEEKLKNKFNISILRGKPYKSHQHKSSIIREKVLG